MDGPRDVPPQGAPRPRVPHRTPRNPGVLAGALRGFEGTRAQCSQAGADRIGALRHAAAPNRGREVSHPLKGLILCAGRGTRLHPLTHTTPKALMPVVNRPVLSYLLEDLQQAGVTEVGIVVNGETSPIVDFLSSDPVPGLRTEFLVQSDPKGLAEAVGLGRVFTAEEPFVVCLGDCFAPGGVQQLVHAHLGTRPEATVALHTVSHPSSFGIVEMADGRIRRFWEKPASPRSDMAVVGLYAFEPTIYRVLERVGPSWRNEYELTDALQALVDLGFAVEGWMLPGHWQDIGRPADVLAANTYQLGRLQWSMKGTLRRCRVEGTVAVGEGTVLESTVLQGPVAVGRRCRIAASHIGPYTCIGDDAQIERSELSGSVLMARCRLEDVRGLSTSLVGNDARLAAGVDAPLRLRLVVGDHCTVWVGEPRPPASAGPAVVTPASWLRTNGTGPGG